MVGVSDDGDVVGVFDDELVGDSVGISEGLEISDGTSVVSVVGDSVGSCIGSSDGMFCEGSVVALDVGVGVGDDGDSCPRS